MAGRPLSPPREVARSLLAGALVLAAVISLGGCARHAGQALRFWALGREGEVVRDLMPGFERRHPGISVEVQQIPFTAAHEKLLTAFVGRETPDVAQVGNTWIPEFAALGALERLDARVASSRAIAPADYFPGIWDTNVVEGAIWGIPWYVDTRVLFYRPDLLHAAGIAGPPRTWDEWQAALGALKAIGAPGSYAILLPTDEWAQPVILAFQTGAELLRDHGRWGAFRAGEFRRAAEFYVSLFRDGYAPPLSNAQVANVYQQFDTGDFMMWITGPWDVGNFRRRLAPARQAYWTTAPLPAPGRSAGAPGLSLAGGSSLVVFGSSAKKDAAFALVEYLSEPEQQARFYALSGDLPARTQVWNRPPLSEDEKARAFGVQLRYVRSAPKVPEWESIAQRIAERFQGVIHGGVPLETTLAALDADTDQILEKRRWLLERKDQRGGGAGERGLRVPLRQDSKALVLPAASLIAGQAWLGGDRERTHSDAR